jgi:hypothetical protein
VIVRIRSTGRASYAMKAFLFKTLESALLSFGSSSPLAPAGLPHRNSFRVPDIMAARKFKNEFFVLGRHFVFKEFICVRVLFSFVLSVLIKKYTLWKRWPVT